MITALNKKTNEVLGFPDGMSQDAIDSAIQSDKMGRPDVDVNPNTYDTVIRPALKEAAQKNDPSIVYNARVKQLQVDPFLSSLFNPFGLMKSSDPNIQEEQKLNIQAHPDQAMIGSLVQQVGTISATAGIAGPVIEPLAMKLGFLARGMTPMAIRSAQVGSEELLPKVAGEAIRKTVTSAASAGMVGALYQGVSSSVEQGKGFLDNNKAPDLLKIGKSMAEGLGWAVYGSGGAFTGKALGISASAATIGGTAYVMSKADGASEADARLNSVLMTSFTAITHGNFSFEARKKLVSDLQDTFAGYTKEKNPDTEQNNIHQLVGDELVGKTAKELLRDKYKAQMEEWNKSVYVTGIRGEADKLRNPEEISAMENEGGGQQQGKEVNLPPKKLTPKQKKDFSDIEKQIQALENEGGAYAINKVIEEHSDTEELVKRLADQVLNMQAEGGPASPVSEEENAAFRKIHQVEIEKGTSKIGKSIEAKSKEQGITEGFENTAQYRPTTFEEQEKLASKEIKDIDNARAMIRGEKPLPKNLEGVALIAEMEKYLKTHPDDEIAYELANSPLVTETSEQARGLSVARMRERDSFAYKISELKQKKMLMAKEVAKDVPKKAKEAMSKINLSKEDLNLDKFLDEIKC